MNVQIIASPQEVIATLPETAKRELAVWLLGQFDSHVILELLRDVRPVSEPTYDYEDPGPLTDEGLADCALQAALRMDQEEAAYEPAATQ